MKADRRMIWQRIKQKRISILVFCLGVLSLLVVHVFWLNPILTETEEMQARTLMNEITELRASLSREREQTVPLDAAAFLWLEHIYQPALQRLRPLIDKRSESQHTGQIDMVMDAVELYCQILEHKWYLSERVGHDVGHTAAIDDYLANIAEDLHNPGA